ncbi:MAG: serine/threonine protein kinase [Gemmatimonadetes bacterium]|nr:MAG: serine/threonine protein kinase [Gemmatimonadota bacterium]
MSTTDGSAELIALQSVVAGRFSLERELGRGGMGIVFLARDVALDRPVAIKLLPLDFSRDPALRERFLREARTAAKLSHPNIVPIHLVEEHGDLVFFVMAYVDGETLGQRVRRAGPVPPSAVRRMMQEVAWAIGYAHERGVIHRDIKPDNILLEKGTGRALLADFGIARVVDASAMTDRREILGTVHYMSPEQACGEQVDGRSDLYSLGATAFFALTGRLPFEAANLPAIIYQQVNESPPRVATLARATPARLAEAVDRCLAKEPAQRFQSGEELVEALGAVGDVARVVPPPVRVLTRQLRDAGVALGIMGSVTFLFIFVMGDDLLAMLPTRPLMLMYLVGFVVVLPTLFLSRLFRATRAVLRAGFSAEDVWNALLAEAREIQEEDAVRPGQGNMEQLRKGQERWIRWAPAIGVFGILAVANGIATGDVREMLIGTVAAIVAVVQWGAGPAVEADSPLRVLNLAERLMIGRFGKWLLRIAGVGLKVPDRVPAALDQRTEIVLASAADQLFDGLPSDVRRRVPDVPAVIQHLQRDAEALRKRETALRDVLARVDIGVSAPTDSGRRQVGVEIEAARAKAQSRMESAVVALENIRLDLLRLHAGVGSHDELTADLEHAREIADLVDAELAASDDVERLLSGRGTPSQPS